MSVTKLSAGSSRFDMVDRCDVGDMQFLEMVQAGRAFGWVGGDRRRSVDQTSVSFRGQRAVWAKVFLAAVT